MTARIHFSALLIITLMAISPLASAGERLTFNVDQAQNRERISVYIQGNQARISSSANTRSAVIFDASARQIHIVDHSDKTVTTLDQASIEQLASMANGVGTFARSQGGVLGDLFKTFGLDNELGDAAQIEVKNVKGKHKIAGFECSVQQVYKDGALDTQLCLSQQLALPGREQQTLDQLIEFAQLLIRQGQVVLQQFSLPIPMLPEQALDGVPVYMKNIPANTTATLLERKQMEIQAAQFSLPANYRKTVLSL